MTIFTSPYVDTAKGGMIFTVASPMYENGQFKGVFGCDITLDKIVELVSKMQITENGYPVLIDGDGNFIVHSNEEYAPQKDGTLKSGSEAEGDYADVISSMSEGVNVGIHKDYDGTEEQRAGQHDLPLMLYV